MITLSKEQIVLLHKQLIDRYGGTHGVRDEGLLDSATNAPFQSFAGYEFFLPLSIKRSGFAAVWFKIIRFSMATKGLAR